MAVFFLCFLMMPRVVFPQEEGQKPIVEKVEVTNVEVPVRVLDKGQPVTNLTAEDFTVYENNKKMAINGFFLNRKTLTLTSTTNVLEPTSSAPLPRTFVLVFNISLYNDSFQKAVDHLFAKILVPSDRVLVLANDVTREYADLKNMVQVKGEILAVLRAEGTKARQRLMEYIVRIETYMNVSDFQQKIGSRDSDRAQRAVNFLKKYMLTWREYQNLYLVPKIDKFYYFSRFLEQVKGQKWVLNFYQFEFFPRIRPGSTTMDTIRDLATELTNTDDSASLTQGRLLENILSQINSELVLNKSFPNETISKLFYKVGATFHSFFIKSSNTAFLQDIEYKSVSSDVEQVLKSITELTGGKNITSTDLVTSIDTVASVEDSFYTLTYVPEDRNKIGSLKIKVKDKKYKVLYDDNFRADYIAGYLNNLEQKIQTPDIQVTDFSFKDKILAFTVTHFLMGVIDGGKAGRMQVRIRLIDKKDKTIFDSSKLLTAQKPDMKISIGAFKTLPKGEYNFLIDAVDMLTNKQDNLVEGVAVK